MKNTSNIIQTMRNEIIMEVLLHVRERAIAHSSEGFAVTKIWDETLASIAELIVNDEVNPGVNDGVLS